MTRPSAKALATAYFPGPASENATAVEAGIDAVLDHWFAERRPQFPGDPGLGAGGGEAEAERERLAERLGALCAMLQAETPSHTPRYIAHMKADLSLPALFAWVATMLHNPNNTSKEASRVGTVIEAEAIAMLAGMLGYDSALAQGHFTSGGTVANFEAMWRARYRLDHWMSLALYLSETEGVRLDPFEAAHMGWERFRELWDRHGLGDAQLRRYSAAASNPADVYRRISRAAGLDYMGPVVLVPGNKHYSWRKAANIFGLGEDSFWGVALDGAGRLDLADFERCVERARAEARPVVMAVSVAGATETGQIDPIHELHALLDRWREDRGWRIWRHVDAAYGGFFRTLIGGDETVLEPETRAAIAAMGGADSITIDPHKLGYTPYSCGAFLARDAAHYAVSAFDAPYLDRPELGNGKWSSTMEGSRSAAGAAAVWLTGETLGFGPNRLGLIIAETIRIRQAFERDLAGAVPQVRFVQPADTNIACFNIARDGESLSSANRRTQALFEAIRDSAGFSVSRTALGPDYAALKQAHLARFGGVEDAETMVVIRCVFMNPYWSEHAFERALFPEFADLVRSAVGKAGARRATG